MSPIRPLARPETQVQRACGYIGLGLPSVGRPGSRIDRRSTRGGKAVVHSCSANTLGTPPGTGGTPRDHAPIATACRDAGDRSGQSIRTRRVVTGDPAPIVRRMIDACGVSLPPGEGRIDGELLRSGHAQGNPVNGVVEIAFRVPGDGEGLPVTGAVGRP